MTEQQRKTAENIVFGTIEEMHSRIFLTPGKREEHMQWAVNDILASLSDFETTEKVNFNMEVAV